MIRALIYVLIFSPIILLGQIQNLGFNIADGKKKVQIPIEIHNNLVVVRVILNNAIPLKFIVDTGVRTAILTQKSFADILQLPYTRKYTVAGPGGENLINAYIANNISLSLPGVIGRGHALLVLEEDYLELRNNLGTDVHGILGYELFSRFILQIDYQKKIMTLMVPQKFKPRKRFEVIPVRVQDTKPYILAPVGISSEHTLNAKLLIDTGASHGLLLEPESDSRIEVPQKHVSNIIGRGLGGEIEGKTARIKSLEIGSITIPDVLANFPDSASYYTDTLKYAKVDRNGTIGGEILSRFNIIFNFPQEKIYLKKNSSFKKAFYFSLSGINMQAKGSKLDVFQVTEVRENSVAQKAGILKGDQITRINGIPSKELHLNQLNGLLNSRPMKKIKLEVKRGDQYLNFDFELVDQL